MNNHVLIQVPYHREKQIAFIMRRRWRLLPIYFLYARREESFAGGKLISHWRGPFFGWQRTRAFMAAMADRATRFEADKIYPAGTIITVIYQANNLVR